MKILPKNRMYITFPEPRDGQDGWLVNGLRVTVEEAARMAQDAKDYQRTLARLEASRLLRKVKKLK